MFQNKKTDTVLMLECAFPDGIDESQYLPLLYLLNQHMGFRSLAQDMTTFFDNTFDLLDKLHNINSKYLSSEDYYALILHDVYGIASYNPSETIVSELQERLDNCGFEIWINIDFVEDNGLSTQVDADELDKTEQSKDMIRSLNVSIKADPANWFLLIQRADFYAEISKLDEALADYTQAIELYPEDYNIYEYRGSFYESQGIYDKALADFSKSIDIVGKELAPFNLYVFRSYLYTQIGDLEKAVHDLNYIIARGINTFNCYFSRAKLFHELDKNDEALKDLDTARLIVRENSAEYQAIDILRQKIEAK